MNTKLKKYITVFSVPAIILIAVLISVNCVKINWTNSEPKGVYLLNNSTNINRNDYVLIPNNINFVTRIAVSRKYINARHTFIKNIYGMPGDLVEINNHVVFINKKPVGEILISDAYDNPLPTILKTGTIPNNHYFVASTKINNSFDSRYFGLISKDQIISKATQLLTF